MSPGWMGGWAPYVPVAERRRKAEKLTAQLRKQGRQLAPVSVEGRLIASTFWGKAWCENLEAYRDYENRLPRGRSYARNGSVIDLQIASGEIRALVNGSELYETSVTIHTMAPPAWRKLCTDCAGRVDSLVELLQGRFSKAVMERLCRQETGLFPRPAEIRFNCSCPDHAAMCKHVAAVLYGVGVRLDEQPELLFRLRGVEGAELLAGAASGMPFAAGTPSAGRVLQNDDVAALFGIDMAMLPEPADESAAPLAKRAARQSWVRPQVRGTARTAQSAAATGKGKVAASEHPAPTGVIMTKSSASLRPPQKAATKSRTAPPTNPSVPAGKTATIKAVPAPRPAVLPSKLSKAAKAPQKISLAIASEPKEKAADATSMQQKPKRDRANWSWKALAAAHKAKRS